MKRVEQLKRVIRVARGETAPDLVLKGGRVVNVFSGEILRADVAIAGDRIAGIGRYNGPRVIDSRDCFISPGFMDGHMHLESTLLAPAALAGAVLARGTTAIMADPHEIANIMGVAGIRYLLESSQGLPVDIYFLLPSCVPATDLETAGASLSASDLAPLRRVKRVLGLAEMMNYPGVLYGSEPVLEKLAAETCGVRDGHAPFLTGRDLNAYIAAGIGSDHECTRLAEAREKLRLGMHLMIREGTQAKNLKTLLPLVNARNGRRCLLVTDDLHPHDLLERGHLDHLLDMAMAGGMAPVEAIRMVTLNTAEYFGLRDVGAVAPGYRADLLLLSSLKPVRVRSVIKGGKKVFDAETPVSEDTRPRGCGPAGAMHIRPFGPEALAVPEAGGRIRVIGLIPDQILTRQLFCEPTLRKGVVTSDVSRDILKLAVVERHRGTGRIGIGFVQGFGLKEGALASSVAHDSHNIIAVGGNDDDLYGAIKAVEAMQGGLAAVCKGKVVAGLPLPIAGLMSDRPLAEVAAGWKALRRAAAELGSPLAEPFMALSFLALPVIPELKLTDRGLVDVGRFCPVPLFVGE
ncbi:MAG: adenine deaminase [Deltaproteobacteria bacterium]|nr:adenine deaminase [Deltaproteobacteria bacterium]